MRAAHRIQFTDISRGAIAFVLSFPRFVAFSFCRSCRCFVFLSPLCCSVCLFVLCFRVACLFFVVSLSVYCCFSSLFVVLLFFAFAPSLLVSCFLLLASRESLSVASQDLPQGRPWEPVSRRIGNDWRANLQERERGG